LKRATNLSLDLFGDRLAAEKQAGGDGGEHRRMLRVMKKAAQGELTARQMECLRLYYGEGKSMSEVAACLGVTASTVSKHLKKARNRLRRVMKYYFARL
jgi:RNA polymerase sigma factor (sigma-70 family)